MTDRLHPSQRESNGGCLGPLLAMLLISGAFWFFVPLNLPIEPGGQDLCDGHDGFISLEGTIIDLLQTQAVVACKDGSVRWVDWK